MIKVCVRNKCSSSEQLLHGKVMRIYQILLRVNPVPEAIRNPVAIKLLVTGLLARHIMLCTLALFFILTGVVFISFLFRASYLSF